MSEIKVKFPDEKAALDQDQEWFEVTAQGRTERLRVHDYDQVYKYPGLYEAVVAGRLKCDSPRVVCGILKPELENWLEEQDQVNVLDMGAGNGMVGEELKKHLAPETLVGVDIFPEAKMAALRDRPGVYDHYCVADLTTEEGVGQLEKLPGDFNMLITVAALGYGDIPVDAFINAFNLLEDGSLVAFNIKDRFLSDQDESGFSEAIQGMCEGSFQVLQSRKYRHRISMSGDPLHYVAVVGQKLKNADPNLCLADLN